MNDPKPTTPSLAPADPFTPRVQICAHPQLADTIIIAFGCGPTDAQTLVHVSQIEQVVEGLRQARRDCARIQIATAFPAPPNGHGR